MHRGQFFVLSWAGAISELSSSSMMSLHNSSPSLPYDLGLPKFKIEPLLKHPVGFGQNQVSIGL
jgi:hypothetical protein